MLDPVTWDLVVLGDVPGQGTESFPSRCKTRQWEEISPNRLTVPLPTPNFSFRESQPCLALLSVMTKFLAQTKQSFSMTLSCDFDSQGMTWHYPGEVTLLFRFLQGFCGIGSVRSLLPPTRRHQQRPRLWSPPPPGFETAVLIMGGYDIHVPVDQIWQTAELFGCHHVQKYGSVAAQDYPVPIHWASGSFVPEGEQVVICGGRLCDQDDCDTGNQCFFVDTRRKTRTPP